MKNITRAQVKTVARFVVARSVSSVIVTIAHQNVTPANRLQIAELYIGAYALGSMVAKHAEDHTNEKIDEIAEALQKFKNVSPK